MNMFGPVFRLPKKEKDKEAVTGSKHAVMNNKKGAQENLDKPGNNLIGPRQKDTQHVKQADDDVF